MDYATTYHIGHHQKTRKGKAKKAAPAGKRIYVMDAANKGCRRDGQGQGEVCTAADAADGFLRTMFLPKLDSAAIVHPVQNKQNIEDGFYASLGRLAAHYTGFTPADTRAYGYPYNIALSIWETEAYLKATVKDWDSLSVIENENGTASIVSTHRCDTGSTLYYIPVMPLYRMLRSRHPRKTACLLLSVCAYLYHVADVPYYRQESTYMWDEYEMMANWIAEDEDNTDIKYTSELQAAAWIGDYIEKKLFNRISLDMLPERISRYVPVTDYERECLQLAEQALALYRDYPQANLFAHGSYNNNSDPYEQEMIRIDQYVSFIADTKGWLYETLSDCINNEFNEYGTMEEPVIQKRFDGVSNPEGNLAFEHRLFGLIERLCYVLNEC